LLLLRRQCRELGIGFIVACSLRLRVVQQASRCDICGDAARRATLATRGRLRSEPRE
jgi:hypothetical protein